MSYRVECQDCDDLGFTYDYEDSARVVRLGHVEALGHSVDVDEVEADDE